MCNNKLNISFYKNIFNIDYKIFDYNLFYDAHSYSNLLMNRFFYKQFLKDICEENGVLPVMELPEGVEAASRENDDERIIFLLNHNDTETEIDLPYPCQNLLSGAKMPAGRIVLPAKDVRLLRQV